MKTTPARRSATAHYREKTTLKNSTLRAAHSVSTQRTKKKKELSIIEAAQPPKAMVIPDTPAGLRFLDTLERLSEAQAAAKPEKAAS